MKNKKNNNPISASLAALATLASRLRSGIHVTKRVGTQVTKRQNRTGRPRKVRLEIDRNDGGRKQNTAKNKVIAVSIDAYVNAIATRTETSSDFNWSYTFNGQAGGFNISQLFLGNQELQYWLALSTEVKIKSIGCTINYSRQPVSGEIWPKWYLLYQTSKVQYKPDELPNNPSTMTLDMNNPGNKVYRMIYTVQNVEKEDIQWQSSDNLQIPRTDIIYTNPAARILLQNTTATQEVIGQVHFYMNIVCRVPEFKNLANAVIHAGKIALREDPLYRNLDATSREKVERKALKMSEKQEILDLMKNKGITKEEAVKLVKKWDLLTLTEEEC